MLPNQNSSQVHLWDWPSLNRRAPALILTCKFYMLSCLQPQPPFKMSSGLKEMLSYLCLPPILGTEDCPQCLNVGWMSPSACLVLVYPSLWNWYLGPVNRVWILWMGFLDDDCQFTNSRQYPCTYPLAMWFWAGCLTPRSLSFLIHKVGNSNVTSQDCCED